jgi:hypothetical protein
MRFYKQTHRFYCGVDLYARSMFVHVLDHEGQTLFDQDLPAGPDAFRAAVAPYRTGLVVRPQRVPPGRARDRLLGSAVNLQVLQVRKCCRIKDLRVQFAGLTVFAVPGGPMGR